MMRAQAHARHRRGAGHAAAAQKGTRRWSSHRFPGTYHTTTWWRVAQAVGSALLCGLWTVALVWLALAW